jgi:hypothetical protein
LTTRVVIDHGTGTAQVGATTLAIRAVGTHGAVGVGNLVVRPLRFGERSRLVDAAATATDPARTLSRLVAEAAAGDGRDPATNAVALHLAGAGHGPGFATALAAVMRLLGCRPTEVLDLPALEVDQLVTRIQPERDRPPVDGGWHRIVFDGHPPETGGPAPDPAAVALELARDLLARGTATVDPELVVRATPGASTDEVPDWRPSRAALAGDARRGRERTAPTAPTVPTLPEGPEGPEVLEVLGPPTAGTAAVDGGADLRARIASATTAHVADGAASSPGPTPDRSPRTRQTERLLSSSAPSSDHGPSTPSASEERSGLPPSDRPPLSDAIRAPAARHWPSAAVPATTRPPAGAGDVAASTDLPVPGDLSPAERPQRARRSAHTSVDALAREARSAPSLPSAHRDADASGDRLVYELALALEAEADLRGLLP